MTRDGGAHLRNRFRKFRDSSKFTKLLRACVALVIEILPASRSVFSDRLHSSIRGRIDEHVRPRGGIFRSLILSTSAFVRRPLLACSEAAFGSAESTYADVLQTFEFCHWNRNCCAFRYSGQSGRLNLSKRIDPLKPKYEIICSWCGALIRSLPLSCRSRCALICHARMLNDYFQRINKKPRIHADKRG
jgi:hypothetical protein